MASIKDLGNNKYRLFVCNGFKPDGRVNRISKVITAKSMRDAEKQAQALEVDFKRGQQIQFSSAPTFSELVDKWREVEKPDIALKTQERYEGMLKNFILPYFGRMKVRDIKALDIEQYLKTLSKDGVRTDGKSGGYSEKTIHHHYMLIQRLLNLAIRWEMLDINPCIRVDAPKVHKKEAKYYEEEEIQRLLECLELECQETIAKFSRRYDSLSPDEAYRRQQVRIFNDLMHKMYIWLALASACRRSELIGLTVDKVDFVRNTITIEQTGHYAPDKGIYFQNCLKNGDSVKIVDMPEAVMQELKVYLEERKTIFYLMGWEDSGYVFVSLSDGTVTQAGGPMLPDVISTWFTRFLEKYQLPKITLHQVRHTSISYLINRGVNIKMVADRAGHQNTRTTEEIYGHIYKKTQRATADEYNDLFTGKVSKEN